MTIFVKNCQKREGLTVFWIIQRSRWMARHQPRYIGVLA